MYRPPKVHRIIAIENPWEEEVKFENLSFHLDETVIFDIVSSHRQIKYLKMRNCNNLSNIPMGTFGLYPNTEKFEITSCNVRHIDIKTFTLARNLQELDLSFNMIKELPNNLFKDAKKLRKIVIQENLLITLPSMAFTGLELLTDLVLSNNCINNLQKGVFDPLTSLERIDLSRNSLRNLNENFFQSNKKLNTIKLNHNGLVDMNELNMLSTTEYKEINLSNNCLNRFTCTSVDQLDLSNASTNLSEVRILGHVKELNLMSNNLKLLHIEKCDMLNNLDISGNPNLDLTFLSKGIFSNLKELNMSGMRLNNLNVDIFMNLPVLTVLDLSNNLFEQINARIFLHLPYLEILKLNDNILNQLEYKSIISMCQKIKVLNIQGNNFHGKFYKDVEKELGYRLHFDFFHFG